MNSIIIDELATLLNLNCLSDLTSIDISSLKKILTPSFLEKYSLPQWNYTFSYILGEPTEFTSLDEIKLFLAKTI